MVVLKLRRCFRSGAEYLRVESHELLMPPLQLNHPPHDKITSAEESVGRRQKVRHFHDV